MWVILWLQASQPELISGNSGWAGAGLLGLVLAWLLFWHLPAKDLQLAKKDEQLLAIVTAAAQAVKVEADAKEAAVKAVIREFREESAAQRAECKDEIDKVVVAINGLSRFAQQAKPTQ